MWQHISTTDVPRQQIYHSNPIFHKVGPKNEVIEIKQKLEMFMENLKYYSLGNSWAPSWPSPLGSAPGHPWRLLGGPCYYRATTGRLLGDYQAGPRECPLYEAICLLGGPTGYFQATIGLLPGDYRAAPRGPSLRPPTLQDTWGPSPPNAAADHQSMSSCRFLAFSLFLIFQNVL